MAGGLPWSLRLRFYSRPGDSGNANPRCDFPISLPRPAPARDCLAAVPF